MKLEVLSIFENKTIKRYMNECKKEYKKITKNYSIRQTLTTYDNTIVIYSE